MRVQKYLSDLGFCSRKQAENLIRQGKIIVNGKKTLLGDKVSGDETIVIDGQALLRKKTPEKKVLVFYKPKGVGCTLSARPAMKTLLDFDFGPDRVFPVGSLDIDSHGLLLLTNDGELGNRLAHPSSEHEEEYLVTVNGSITAEIIDIFRQGVMLERKRTAQCSVEQAGDNVLRFVLHEGRNRQIRKMCNAVGMKVLDLQRIRIGTIVLEELLPGNWKVLDATEFKRLKNV